MMDAEARPEAAERWAANLPRYFTESDCAASCPGIPTACTSMSSFRITRFVALRLASSNPCPCVIASVGHASTQ